MAKLAGGAVGLMVAIILCIIGAILNSNAIFANGGLLFYTTIVYVVGHAVQLLCWWFLRGT